MNGREAAWMRMPEPSASGEKWREEMCTRCYIPPELTVTNDSNGCPILPVPIGLHDLNLSKTYANWIQGFTSIRELMQNWYDRTLEVLDGHPTALIDTGWVDGTHRLAFHELHRTEGKPRCASYVLEQRRPDGKVYVQLTNFATELPKDALIMGCSRKSTADAAGAYGEGMKVEINCLVARGVEVCIFTGSRRWNFVHNVEPGSSESKLFMQVTEVDQRCAHLSICLLADVSILNEVDRTCFLFLQLADVGKPMAPDKRGGDKVVEVLLHEDHHGKTFARGIFIKSEPTLVGIGLNFIAPLRLHKSFGFTRDRDDIDLELLIAWLPNVVSHLFRERKQDFGEALVWRLYDILDSAPQSDVAKHLALSFRSRVRREGESIDQAREHLADRLVGVFQARHHDKAQPYPIEAMSQRSSLQEERREAIFLQCTPVDVSEPLLKHLRLSKLCPTTERIWNQLQERVYELADWQPPSEQARDTAERFRSLALEWFGDALSSESLLFKEFPAGNPNVVAIGKKESRTILAVDVKLLDDSQATHEWIRKEQGQVCGDKQPDGTCGGACTLFRYSDALTQCLEKISPQLRGKLEKTQKMAMMRMQTRDLPNQPLPPPPKPPDTSGQRDDQDAVASTPTASSGHDAGIEYGDIAADIAADNMAAHIAGPGPRYTPADDKQRAFDALVDPKMRDALRVRAHILLRENPCGLRALQMVNTVQGLWIHVVLLGYKQRSSCHILRALQGTEEPLFGKEVWCLPAARPQEKSISHNVELFRHVMKQNGIHGSYEEIPGCMERRMVDDDDLASCLPPNMAKQILNQIDRPPSFTE